MFEYLLIGFVFCIIWAVISYFILLLVKNPNFIDVSWVLSICILCIIYYIFAKNFTLTSTIYLTIILCWTVRLEVLMLFRLLQNKIDPRYITLEETWKKNKNLRYAILLFTEMLCSLLLTLPFLFSALYIKAINTYSIIFLSLCVLSIIGEGVADAQLLFFKQKEENRGRVCSSGLWKFSRHPNYFFQWLFWLSGSLIVLPLPLGFLSLTSPILMFIILYYLTGIPLAEKQSLKSKGSLYIEYQRKTSKFFPWMQKN